MNDYQDLPPAPPPTNTGVPRWLLFLGAGLLLLGLGAAIGESQKNDPPTSAPSSSSSGIDYGANAEPDPSPADYGEDWETPEPEPELCVRRYEALKALKRAQAANNDVMTAASIGSKPLLIDALHDGGEALDDLSVILDDGGEYVLADDVADVASLWEQSADAWQSGAYARGVKLYSEGGEQFADIADRDIAGLPWCN